MLSKLGQLLSIQVNPLFSTTIRQPTGAMRKAHVLKSLDPPHTNLDQILSAQRNGGYGTQRLGKITVWSDTLTNYFYRQTFF